MLFVGDDWAEAHHDVEIVDERRSACWRRRRLPEGVAGLAGLHALIADHLGRGRRARPGDGRDRDRPRSVGAGPDRRRVHRVRGQPVAGGPVSGTARHVGGEERPR